MYVYNYFVKYHGHVRFEKIRALFSRIISCATKLRCVLLLNYLAIFWKVYQSEIRGMSNRGGSVFITRICSYFANYVICKTTRKYAATLQRKVCKAKKVPFEPYLHGYISLPVCTYYFTPVSRPLRREFPSPILIYPCVLALSDDPNLNDAKCLRSVHMHNTLWYNFTNDSIRLILSVHGKIFPSL